MSDKPENISDAIDQACDEFERSWLQGLRPRLEDHLGQVEPAEHGTLFRELLWLELQYRTDAGETPILQEFLGRFPGQRESIGHVFAQAASKGWPVEPVETPAAEAETVFLGEADADTEGRASEADSQPLPETIGKYRVLAELPGGGQARVFRVAHPVLAKELVLKWSREALQRGTDDGRHHLVAEGRVLAELDHPNLARVVDVDFHDDRAFVVTEFIRGRTLEQYGKEQRPASREAAVLVAKIARALAPAHRQGVIHQDIKAANILIDEKGEPRVIDFGLARLRNAWADDRGQVGTVSGTIPYMAPEQARGETDRLGPATDIFALGAVLYELLVGSPPFVAATRSEALERAKRCDIDRSALAKSVVPHRLQAICLKAMAAEPSQRYSTVEALAEELESFSRPRRYGWWTAAAGVVAILVILSAWWFWPEPDAPRIQYLVQLQRGDRVFEPGGFPRSLPARVGDELRIVCEIPLGMEPTLYVYDSDGELQVFAKGKFDVTTSAGATKVAFPGQKQSIPLDDHLGTEFLLICASKEGENHQAEFGEVIQQVFMGRPLPRDIPKRAMVAMTRKQVAIRSAESDEIPRGLGKPKYNSLSELESLLERLRLRLHDQSPFFVAVAFPHAE